MIGYVSDCIYWGLFIEDRSLFKSNLENEVVWKHVTFGFKTPCPIKMVGSRWTLKIVGYACDGDNEAYLVELPHEVKRFYGNVATPHITVSTSKDGKPKNSGYLPFERLPEEEQFECEAVFGYVMPTCDEPILSPNIYGSELSKAVVHYQGEENWTCKANREIGYLETVTWVRGNWANPESSGLYTVQLQDGRLERWYWCGSIQIAKDLIFDLVGNLAYRGENKPPEEFLEDLRRMAELPFFWYTLQYGEDPLDITGYEIKQKPEYWLGAAPNGPVGRRTGLWPEASYKYGVNGMLVKE